MLVIKQYVVYKWMAGAGLDPALCWSILLNTCHMLQTDYKEEDLRRHHCHYRQICLLWSCLHCS